MQLSPLISEYFHHPKTKLDTHEQSLPIPSSPQSLATTNLLSICMDLPIVDNLYKLTHNNMLC